MEQNLTFADLGLSKEILQALEQKGYGYPTRIQAEAIPPFMQWKDVIAKAPTGTGKTFAFGIPMLEHIDPESEEVQAVIMAPTRELAMQITAEPATLAVSLNHGNYTNRCVSDTGYFSVCVLAEDCDPKLIGKFGFFSSKEKDKFADFSWQVRGKLPVPDGAMCWFSCRVIDKMETATHTVFLGEVMDADVLKAGTPMTYAYYHKVLKGKTAAKAPTYIAPEAGQTAAKYVCKICGYVYDGKVPFE